MTFIHRLCLRFVRFKCYRSYPDADESHDCSAAISEDIRVEVTKKLLDMLPAQNRLALGILCRFLQQMAEHSESTLMDIKNLSVVFSPNILRPRVETPETLICTQTSQCHQNLNSNLTSSGFFQVMQELCMARSQNL